MAQLHETELELEGKRSNCRQLEQENQLLCGSIEDLKTQQVSVMQIVWLMVLVVHSV